MRGNQPATNTTRGRRWLLYSLMMGIVLVGLVSLKVGSLETGTGAVIESILSRVSGGNWGAGVDTRVETVVLNIRMPRMLMAMSVGAALATAGACLQGLFRNPLADPGLIGVSSGGAIGSIAAISTLGTIAPAGGLLANQPRYSAMTRSYSSLLKKPLFDASCLPPLAFVRL